MTRKRIFSNISWMLLERVFITLIVLASNIYVIRTLGAHQFGELAYFQALLGLLIVAADFGLRRVLLVSFGKLASGKLVSATLLLKTIAAVFLIALCTIAWIQTGDDAFLILLVYCAFAPVEVYAFVMQAELRNDRLAKIRTVLALTGAGTRVWLCMSGLGFVQNLLLTYVLQSVLLFLFTWAWTRFGIKTSWHISYQNIRQVWRISKIVLSKSIYYFFSMLVIQAHYRVDQLMISGMMGSTELGIYSSAYKLVEQLIMIPAIVSAVLLPQMALKRKNRELTLNRLSMIYGVTMLAAIAIAVPVMLMAGHLIQLAYGSEFSAASPVLFYLMLGLPFLFIANMSGLYFSVMGQERQAFIRNVAGLFVNIALNLFMIPRYGATGAALTTVVSYFVVAYGAELVFWTRFKEHLHIKYRAISGLLKINFYKDLMHVLLGKQSPQT